MPGILTIVSDTAVVTADFNWITAGDSLPEFTASFGGFNENDDESVVDSLYFTVEPEYTGAAGVYQIIPHALAENYYFSQVSAPLYVNPYGSGAQNIIVGLLCSEPISPPDSNGYNSTATFTYTNNNPSALYIPVGSNNLLSGASFMDAADQPQLFMPGTGSFTVSYFAIGSILKWTVKSYDNTILKPSSAFATFRPCESGEQEEKQEEAEILPGRQGFGDFRIYPNPSNGKFYLEFIGELNDDIDLSIYDSFGNLVHSSRPESREGRHVIDLSGSAPGVYIVKIKSNDSVKTQRIILVNAS